MMPNFRTSVFLSILSVLILVFSNCSEKKSVDSNEVHLQENKSVYSYETLELDNGWTYKIYMNNKLFIFQKSIPSVPGVSGFKNQEAAERIARLVIYKLSNGLMPPSVSQQELDSLGVL